MGGYENFRKARLALLTVALALYGRVAAPANSSEWPTHPIRVVVPFPAGSAADVAGRIVTERLAQKLGQPIVVDNRPGAASTIGSAVVVEARPDGYTLLITSSTHTLTSAVYPKLKYSPANDFVGVAPLSYASTVYVVAASKGYRTIADLAKAARARPGGLNFASSGIGSITHLGGAALKTTVGFPATHVPYKGTVEALTDLIAGRVDYFLGPVSAVLPYIKEGKLTALATCDNKRVGLLPDVPTTAELGYPNLAFAVWMGMFAPAKTPSALVERLNQTVNEILDEPDVRTRIEATGSSVIHMTVPAFASMLHAEFQRNAKLVQETGLTGK